MRSPFAVFVALIVAFAQLPASASDFKWWATSSPYKATNGQITLPNASGTSRTIQTNPTGANVSTRTANTQAPTVVVQATASMPIKAVGDACVASNSSDNLYANENHAITADRTSLLSCQSGSWAPMSKVSRYASIDLSAALDKGPDGMCTAVLSTRYLVHTFELDSNSLLLLNGYMATANVAENWGSLCLFVNETLCNAESLLQFSSASASCIVPVSAGTVTIRIVGAHRYGLHAFKTGYAVIPM